ncbi:trichohyalin-like isoform X2 [Lingula anatina]|uniref:Trichohyalin-like isoform X2 n=1 Tax=Lingula anatina TaxID=7574 RepID=A0A1S3JMC9_LINAN|nr:trichohyalin-like isoform X2 [Lingula anatina]|eukprot:XP_013411543.1 trichohyalin-like isoform X2 [Lingula anatina]
MGSTLGSMGSTGARLGSSSDGLALGEGGGGKKFLKSNRAKDAPSSMMSKHEEKLDLGGMSDSDSDNDRNNLKNIRFDLAEMEKATEFGYETSEASDKPAKPVQSESDSEDYGKDIDFGIDRNLDEKIALNLSDDDEESTQEALHMSGRKKEPTPQKRIPSGIVPQTQPPKKTFDDDLHLDFEPATKVTLPSPSASGTSMEDERKRKAEMAALAALAAEKRAESDRQLKAEEEKLKAANEKALDELRKKLQEEEENAKLEMLEEKEERLSQLRKDIQRETEAAERDLRQTKENKLRILRDEINEEIEDEETKLMQGKLDSLAKIRREMKVETEEETKKMREEHAKELEKIKAELAEVRNKERGNIEEERKKAREEIKKEIEEYLSEEKEKLEEEKQERVDEINEQYEKEIEEMTKQLQKEHNANVQESRKKIIMKHEQDMKDLETELKTLQQNELDRKEQEVKAARERQKAVDDLERGLDDVLKEKKDEIKAEQNKVLADMKADFEKTVKKMQDEYKQKEKKEKEKVEQQLETLKKELKQKQQEELEEVREEFDDIKKTLRADLQQELDDVQKEKKKKTDLRAENEKELNKIKADFEKQSRKQKEDNEKQLKKMKAELEQQNKEWLEEQKEKAQEEQELAKKEFENELTTLKEQLAKDLEQMKKEYEETKQQLKEELKQKEDKIRKKAAEIQKQKEEKLQAEMAAEPSENELSDEEKKEKTRKKPKAAKKVKIVENGDLGSDSDRDETTPKKKSVRRRKHQSEEEEDFSLSSESEVEEEVEVTPKRSTKRTSGKTWSPGKSRPRTAWKEEISIPTADEFFDFVHSDKMKRLLRSKEFKNRMSLERNSISVAEEFFRKQRQDIRRRQAEFKAATREYERDMERFYKEGLSPAGKAALTFTKARLDKEAQDLDALTSNVSTGSRLVKEKEKKIKEWEASLLESESDSDTFQIFDHPKRPPTDHADLLLTDSDEESSGISSSDLNLDDLAAGVPSKPSYRPTSWRHKPTAGSDGADSIFGAELRRLNQKMEDVINFMKSNGYNNSGGATEGPYGPSTSERLPHTRGPYPQVSTNPDNPYNRANRAAVSGEIPPRETADEFLQKKWRKYFGDSRPPLPLPSQNNHRATTFSLDYTPASELIRQQMGSKLLNNNSSVFPPHRPVQEQLAESKAWLREYELKHPLRAASVATSTHAPLTSGAPMAPLSTTTPGLSSPHATSASLAAAAAAAGRFKFELDDANSLRVRHY